MRIGMLAWLAACSYTPDRSSISTDVDAPPTSSDGRLITDGPPDPDTPTPKFVAIDTIIVSANGTPIDSSVALTNGKTYRLRASGTWFIDNSPPTEADAEYFGFPGAPTDGAGFDVGLAIDDLIVDANGQPNWGVFRADHVYEIDWVGDGTPITAKIHDQNYSNNSGQMTLVIFELQ